MKRSSEAKKRHDPKPERTQRSKVSTRRPGGQARRRPAERAGEGTYWMRCPRCGLGLIETVKGAISTERCTACKAVWADPQDVERAWSEGTPELFKSFKKE